MKIKNIVTSIAVAGAALLTFAGFAAAAPTMNGDINIYGASAQFNFWKGQSVNYMTQAGCTSIQSSKTTDGKNWIAKGTCGGNTRYFRASSKASYDGPLAVQGNTTNPNRTTACANPNERKMMEETAVTSWGTGTNATTMADTAVACKPVNGGASDVMVTSFTQESHGMLLGPSSSTKNVYTDRSFIGTGALTAAGLTDCRTLVVPFGFFLNNGVTKNSGQPVNDITTAQARLIFSGQIMNWSDLGFDAKPLYACWRHAGSGTAATLDWAVMKPAGLNTYENVGSDVNEDRNPYFYFNDGGQDAMNCINGNSGGVGYADADMTLSANVHALTYNGVAPTKANIENGLYDFYSVQNLYTTTPTPTDLNNLCSFMKNPANNTNAWYPVACEMQFIRDGDTSYSSINNNYGVCN